jgi:hypothetical protein
MRTVSARLNASIVQSAVLTSSCSTSVQDLKHTLVLHLSYAHGLLASKHSCSAIRPKFSGGCTMTADLLSNGQDSKAGRQVLASRSVCVIGAGAAGLVAAKELQDEGHVVTVFEQVRSQSTSLQSIDCLWQGSNSCPWSACRKARLDGYRSQMPAVGNSRCWCICDEQSTRRKQASPRLRIWTLTFGLAECSSWKQAFRSLAIQPTIFLLNSERVPS